MNLSAVQAALEHAASPEKASQSTRFFKTGPGEYGAGDMFRGITVPAQRKIAKQFRYLPLDETSKLLSSPWHEDRLTGLFILVHQYQRADAATQLQIYQLYLTHAGPVGFGMVHGQKKTAHRKAFGINNWDLVDSSASFIVGHCLRANPQKIHILKQLALSPSLWERRIAMLSCFYDICQGSATSALVIAEVLLNDQHDLIQKAVGWMLRELGKRVDRQLLLQFLDQHAATMPRTSLRYAIEHLSPQLRSHYLQAKAQSHYLMNAGEL